MAENGNGNGKTSEALANNVILTVTARFGMIAATVALPVVGWLMIRGVNSVDDVGHKIDIIREKIIETSGNVKLIQQTQTIQGQILQDHEMRMRLLERPKSPN